jgi:hypothetical protein
MKRIVELPVPKQCLASKFRLSDSQDVIKVSPAHDGPRLRRYPYIKVPQNLCRGHKSGSQD